MQTIFKIFKKLNSVSLNKTIFLQNLSLFFVMISLRLSMKQDLISIHLMEREFRERPLIVKKRQKLNKKGVNYSTKNKTPNMMLNKKTLKINESHCSKQQSFECITFLSFINIKKQVHY
jgi:hypothetical protein